MFANREAVERTIYREIDYGNGDSLCFPGHGRWVMTALRHILVRIGEKLKF